MKTEQGKHHVVVVGAGPVGLLTAYLLRRMQVDVTLLERRHSRSTQSKASSMNAYSLAIMDMVGLADAFIEQGMPIHDLLVYWNNRRTMHVNYRHLPSVHDYILGISQPETEAVLEHAYRDLGGSLQRGSSVTALTPTEQGVEVELDDGRILSSDYVVGCDGSLSTVRTLMGIEFEGSDFGVEFFMFDAQVSWAGEVGKVHYYVREDSFFLIIPQAGGTHRVIIKASDGKVAQVQGDPLAFYQELTDRYGRCGVKLERIIWESNSRFYNRLARRYSQGRVFLCGDACHLFSPVGGLGMNTGFQDAFNLAWKLAGVLNGNLYPSVLESYEHERQPVAAQMIATTDANTRLILRQDCDPAGALRRWLPTMDNRHHIAVGFPMTFSGLGQRYGEQALVAGGGRWVGRLLPSVQMHTDVGVQSSHALMRAGRFVLLVRGACPTQLSQQLQASGQVDVVSVIEVSAGRNQAMALRKGEALLVRPDGVVALQAMVDDPNVFLAYLSNVLPALALYRPAEESLQV
ncbi:FAD-dependent oxidoreductase [Pseudomonas alloputida]|uniref:FAD-dependent oxidoreductase n=3 Tax=Pseudomonas TaxID=286 RepID=A0ABD6N6T7_9PSED|nr:MULTISPECIES: FAD-dependent oxidoreductase [Pseudomonas]EKT4474435.1 FAD-dependent oxidoreductase [Pseudomonas putida]MCX2705168.1 FAD-dependent oxidoreductase [Pseudomonas sp. DCB_BG]MDD2138669.1 FAD-dependent oxidoreductase [Pseudomonas putida]MDD2147462.1 FAD-dependent oxidoreductase [Pseudomonas putida]MDF3928166.1 FAD-dependent oxidoreductase [Pseudomonas putida]